MVLLLKQLHITSCVADFISELFRRSVTNSSFVWFREIALNVNKEIIRLTISYLKVSERFIQILFWLTKVLFVYLFDTFLFIYSLDTFLPRRLIAQSPTCALFSHSCLLLRPAGPARPGWVVQIWVNYYFCNSLWYLKKEVFIWKKERMFRSRYVQYSYIPCFQAIVAHRFTCGKKKIW